MNGDESTNLPAAEQPLERMIRQALDARVAAAEGARWAPGAIATTGRADAWARLQAARVEATGGRRRHLHLVGNHSVARHAPIFALVAASVAVVVAGTMLQPVDTVTTMGPATGSEQTTTTTAAPTSRGDGDDPSAPVLDGAVTGDGTGTGTTPSDGGTTGGAGTGDGSAGPGGTGSGDPTAAGPSGPGSAGPTRERDSTPTTPAASATLTDVHAVDFGNHTYPTTVCPEAYRRLGDSFTLVDGRIGLPPDRPAEPDERIGVTLDGLAFGDLTGDGRDEAALRFTCGIANSDGFQRVVTVLGLIEGQARPLATIYTSGTNPQGTFVSAVDDSGPVQLRTGPLLDDAESLSIARGRLTIGWKQWDFGGDAYGLGYRLPVSYRLTAGTLVETDRGALSVIPFTESPNSGSRAYYAIRSADIGSMTLPLNAARRGARQRVCGDLLDQLGPVADARLTNGSATLTAPDGTALDGRIEVLDVRYGAIDYNDNEEALVLVRCQAGSSMVQRALVVRAEAGGLRVTDAVPSPVPFQAVEISLRHNAGPYPLIRFGATDGAQQVILYSWTAGGLEPATR